MGELALYKVSFRADEETTIRTLRTYRGVITSLIQQHHGRVVDSPSDNLSAEFASAVDAVQGAAATQTELKTRNAELSAYRQRHYRIGINVGDVVVEGERIYWSARPNDRSVNANQRGFLATGSISPHVSHDGLERVLTKNPRSRRADSNHLVTVFRTDQHQLLSPQQPRREKSTP